MFINLTRHGDYFEPIDYSLFDVDNIDPVFRQKLYVNMLPYAQIYAYRTDAFKGKAPKDNKDLWDTTNFPGPRSLQSGASGSNADLEVATMAAGAPADKVYPIDLDKAFASLAKIKPNVTKWWDAGAIPAQLLNDDEVVMATAWNGRIAAIQANKAPVEIVWQDQLLRNDCWAVINGAANAANAQKFTAFITMAVPQARLSSLIPYGFVNNKSAGYLVAGKAEASTHRARHQEQAGQLRYPMVGGQHGPDREALERLHRRLISGDRRRRRRPPASFPSSDSLEPLHAE